MKVILMGGTGFVGGEVLSQLLAHPGVDGVTCLARRPLAVTHSKLGTILHEDFTTYSDEVLDTLASHGSCLWALGAKAAGMTDEQTLARVTYQFALTFARAICARGQLPFRFCYLSGMGADPSEKSWFPWERATRHLKGRTERDLHRLMVVYPEFTAVCFRPGGILPRQSGKLIRRLLAPLVIGVEDLARAFIRVAVKPMPACPGMVTNAQIKRLATMQHPFGSPG